jgi:hypothetical protein
MSWSRVFGENQYMYGVAVDPDKPSTIFGVSFDSGAYRSDDSGRTWRRLKGYNFKWGSRPYLDPYNKDMMYITTMGNSVNYGPREGMQIKNS